MERLNSQVTVTARDSGYLRIEVAGQVISVRVNHAKYPPTTLVWVNKGLVEELS